MIFVIDANLSARWAPVLQSRGHTAVYWSLNHAAEASDIEIIHYAEEHQAVVLTQDLDFGMHLADLRLATPSVVQLRSKDTSPEVLAELVLAAVQQYVSELERGALITIDARGLVRTRVSLLPLS